MDKPSERQSDLKIYSADYGWRGGIVVIADSLENAREKMKSFRAFEPEIEIVEHDLDQNFGIEFDCS